MDDNTKVSLAALDSALTHMQETNKRLGRIVIFALIVVGIMFSALIYFLTQFEVTTEAVDIDTHQGAASYNYIGNDGDIDNGAD